MSTRHLVLAAALLALSTTGCYVTHAIRTDQLPAVSRGYDRASGPPITMYVPNGYGGVRATTLQPMSRSKVTLRAPDGSSFVVRGTLDLVVSTTDGAVHRFDGPVQVEDRGDAYFLRSPSLTGRLPRAAIRSAEVRSLSLGRTIAASVGGAALGVAAILVPIALL